ncbi:hypothetical protein ASPACDRAFT_82062 [Aspergillus aculeatus ATCC 16872]|uniref:Macro-like domain-containing protein n=1 Tax=Aspergillus aculeatus (strain ATCC 16872 / CBS 172.66 / WB 5094) TaxID=690307 RepID=A0A1L9WGA6_ASPA1|nr:uncharacterized protein ASPACDRAFT_82062 [Aspergillus aculeatus ATCC 16872]OJJ95200.1 hypothetical protein ASPACDRAFT_82062 [Aspergillus aculeatus ATCC 16872]
MSLQDIPEFLLLCREDESVTAFEAALARQWPAHATEPKVQFRIVRQSLRDVPATTPFDLIVSPANSYGLLDGAFDDAITRKFCLPDHPYETLTRAAQRVLYERWRGFVPPGTCTLVPFPESLTPNEWGCRWVALCPTMRMPDRVSWDREVVYECIWSLLGQLEGWNRGRATDRIERILIPPLATGVGRVSPQRWAAQMVLAVRHFVDALERPAHWSKMNWLDAADHHRDILPTWNM